MPGKTLFSQVKQGKIYNRLALTHLHTGAVGENKPTEGSLLWRLGLPVDVFGFRPNPLLSCLGCSVTCLSNTHSTLNSLSHYYQASEKQSYILLEILYYVLPSLQS